MVPGSDLRQPADLEQLAEARFRPLSPAEIKLLHAALKGETAYCGPSERDDDPSNDPANSATWSLERSIRADLFRWLCVDRDAKDLVDARGIRVHAARITEKLDLSFIVVPFFLGLLRCSILEEPDLRFIEVPFIDLTGTCLPSLNAGHATVKGSISLNGLCAQGNVQLLGASIGGNLECDGGKFQNPAQPSAPWTGVALDATNAKVTGQVLLGNGFVAAGTVRLYGAEIGGTLVCAAGKFLNPAQPGVAESGIALEASNAKVTGAVLLREEFVAAGTVRLFAAEIGESLDCGGGEFRNPAQPGVAESGIALEASNARVTGNVFLCKFGPVGQERQFVAAGQVRFYGAQIGGSLACDGGQFQNPAQPDVAESGMALNAEGAKIGGSVYLGNEFAADGQVRLYSTEIGGSLACDGGQFRNPARPSLAASGIAIEATNVKVAGDVLLGNEFAAEGQVWLFGAEIGRNLACDRSKFQNPAQPDLVASGIALDASYAKVGGAVYLRNGFAQGVVRLFGAQIGANLECDAGKFQNSSVANAAESGIALSAEGTKVGGAVYLRNGFAAQGGVRLFGAEIGGNLECWQATFESLDLTNASAGALQDDEASWPKSDNLVLDGFVYGRISYGPVTAAERLQWLARQASFTPHPYRQLAKVLKEAGDDHGWRRVGAEMERRAWAGRTERLENLAKQAPFTQRPFHRLDYAARSWIVRLSSYLLRATIGYGYLSKKALWWLLALVLAGSLVYHWGYEAGSMVPTNKDAYDNFAAHKPLPEYYEGFYAFPYSLENSFPLVKLGIEDKWSPGPDEAVSPLHPVGWTSRFLLGIASPRFLRGFRWFQICAGWILATLFVAGVTGVIRND